MLALFEKSIGKGPEELTSPTSKQYSHEKNGMEIMDSFVSSRPQVITTRFQDMGAFLAYTHENETLLHPRLFASVEDIFCIFVGTLENLCVLRRQYGLSKTTTEALLMIEAYKTLRDRGPYPPDQVVKDLNGRFAFVLFDSKCSTVFAAVDGEASTPLYWGTALDGSLVFSDDPDVLHDGCGKSFAPFPAGCMFSNGSGLQSYEHPLNKMKAMPRVDSEGHMCGATFKVDKFTRINSIPRVGSATNWATSV
eukprot:Gb_40778 [translate_table: standard]